MHLRQDRGQNSDRARGSDEDGVHNRGKDVRVLRRQYGHHAQHPEDHHRAHEQKRPNLHMGARPRQGRKSDRLQPAHDPRIRSFDHEKKLRKALGHVPVHLSANVAIVLLGFRERRLARRSFQRAQFFEQDEKRLRLSEEDTEILFYREPGVLP